MLPHLSVIKNRLILKAIVSALFLFFFALPLPLRAQFGGPFDPAIAWNTLQTNLGDTVKNTSQKIWDLLKEHSGLLWKQTQVYFGTRLAQDAAIYLASGGKGQSSFIWNVSEIKKLAGAAAGEYLDNLSKSYFGKSACQPGDLRTMVQIDLSARGLITGISNVRTKVCEEICQRTAVPELNTKTGDFGSNPDATGAERAGDLAQSGIVNELSFSDQFNAIKKDLDGYANSAKDLMKEITKTENDVRLGVGKYIWDNVRYTFDILNDMEDVLVFMSGSYPFEVTIGTEPLKSFTDPQELREYLFGADFRDKFKAIIANGANVSYWVEQKNQDTGVSTYVQEQKTAEKHGDGFAVLVDDIFERFYNKYPLPQEDKRYQWGFKDIDNFFKGNSVTAGIGLEWLAKTIADPPGLPPLISFTFQSKYASTEERQLVLGDMFLAIYQKELGEIYELFAANENAIARKALLARPPNIPEIPEILDVLDPHLDIRSFTKDDPFQKADDYVKFVALNNKSKVYASIQDIPDFPKSDYDQDDLISILLNPFIKKKNEYQNIDSLSASVVALSANKQIVNSKYPDLKQFTDAFAKFNQCVQACESAKLKEPKGTCTLDKITNGPGALGVTGLTGGVSVDVQGSPIFSETGTTAIGKQDEENQTAFNDTNTQKRKRIQVEDLQDFATIGFPGQNPLGQILDIALQTQGMSEEARRQAEVEAQAKDFKPKKSLISGDVKVTSSMNAGRLQNAQDDIRAANNTYTDSILAQMWGVFFNTLLEEFQKKLYDKGLDPKLYGGAFNPITRQAFGKGVASAERQLGQVFKPNITPGGVITTQILTNLASGCEKQPSKRRFDECIIDENFKQAIEQRLTLEEAVDKGFINGNGAFGFVSGGTEPQIQYGSGGTGDSGQGIPYKSMIVLRKYRIIPSSWEVAATWIKEVALKSADGKPAPGKVTLNDVMNGFDDKTSPYYGLVSPNWVLKLPQFQCNRQGAGEEIITETPSENLGATNTDPFDVQITRTDNYCADPVSCIREKTDGTGCAEYGYCTAERDFWQFPSRTCEEIDKTCQAYTDNFGKTVAYLEQTLDINGECSESSDGCTGFVRDYNYRRFIGEIGSRGDGKSDTAFTFSPNRFTVNINDPEVSKDLWLPDPSLYPGNSTVNAAGFVDTVPNAFECTSLGKTCTYEQIAGRAEGCAIPGTNGVQCNPWKEEGGKLVPANIITDVSKNQKYWCGLPGGAGCFVGKTAVIKQNNVVLEYVQRGDIDQDGDIDISLDTAVASGHSTLEGKDGVTCVVGSWQYQDNALIFKATAADSADNPAPLTCSLYRDSEAAQAGTKRVYLNDNARVCKEGSSGCQQYYKVEFGSDVYTKLVSDDPKTADADESLKSYSTFLTLEAKKEFTEQLLAQGRVGEKTYWSSLIESQRDSFDYTQVPISSIMPQSLQTDPATENIEFASLPRIVPVQMNATREYCTEREVACRRYTENGGGTVSAIINPRENQCPNECAGFERYREPLTLIERKLGSRAVVTDPDISEISENPALLDRYLIPNASYQCSSADAGCESFIKSDNDKEVIRMYLKDIRLCVNPDHKKADGERNANAVYTIIESSATGATRPVNVELLQSDFTEPIYYTVSDGKVIVSETKLDGYSPLYDSYHGPCMFMDPEQNQGMSVDKWQCNDIFDGIAEKGIDGIKQNLERCLVLNDTEEPVTDLTNADCREYIYFGETGGAERYPVPEDAPVYASPTCDVLKRGDTNGLAYPIDPQSPILSRFTCSESSVSCREYQGPGFQTNGPLPLEFEESETRWVGGLIPKKAPNVNGLEDEAILFNAEIGEAKYYYFDILSIPKDITTAQIYDGKSFVLTFWGKGSGNVEIALGSGTYDEKGNFTLGSERAPFALGVISGEWRSQVSPQLSPVYNNTPFLPTHLVITVPQGESLTLDNITLTMSGSVYFLRNAIEPASEDGWNTPKVCNTDFTKDPPVETKNAQLGCRAYTSDRDEPLAFKSYGLCRDEAVGCTAVINTFNTSSPEGETFIPRGIDENTLGAEDAVKNKYTVPPDALEYIVVPNDLNADVFCRREEVGCTLLGKETRDQTGRVIGFVETARIDDPQLYSQGDSSIACLVSENSCGLYKRNEDESPARFKDPGKSACVWLSDDQSPTKQQGWFKKQIDSDGNVTDDYEICELSYEMLDESIDYKVPRSKGYCVEKSTGRPVLNPVGSGYYPTAWCDPLLGSFDCINFIRDPINFGINESEVVCAQTPLTCDPKESQCTWYKDPLGEGLGQHYFQIKIDPLEAEGNCKGKVSDDAGCRLFDDTSVTTEPKLKYNARAGRDGGTLDAALLCQNAADDNKNIDDLNNPDDCDTNQLIEVDRDRSCGEWLACSSAIVTGKENETVCVERKPCNIAGGGECVNFVEDAKQSFESKELGDKAVRDRVGNLSGLSNEGYAWSRCNSAQQVATQKIGSFCQSGIECAADYACVSPSSVSADDAKCEASQDLLYVKLNTETNEVDPSLTCQKAGDNWNVKPVLASGACVESICQLGLNQGKACTKNKECFAENELFFGINPPSGINLICGESAQITSLCGSYGGAVKPGLKPFDEIREIGAHADIANGDFENAFVDMKESAARNSVSKTQGLNANQPITAFPSGWEFANCGSDNKSCALARRYDPPTLQGVRNKDVHNGKYSLNIGMKDGYVTQTVENVIPDAVYTVSGWLKVSSSDKYSGVEVDELNADGDWMEEKQETTDTQTRCNLSWSGTQTHCLRAKQTNGNNGWQFFTTTFTTAPETRQFRITLKNRGGGSIFFDDIQLRAHLSIADDALVAPSCRIYPESDSLTCDARDKQGNRIRGWRGYCIEKDPRNSDQCLNWWPTDVIQGETNVLGQVEEAGYKGQAPLYYCAESMDKAPGVPLPRLVCLARNDVSQSGADIAFEACKIVALVSDPKPSFYTLSDDDWRIGVDANDFGPLSTDQGGAGGYKARMVLDSGIDPSGSKIGGLCVLNETGKFIEQGDPPNCLDGCFLAQGLGGWGENKKNLGIPVFFKGESEENSYGGCTWSKNGSNWSKCAQDIEKYYHKTAYFYFTGTDITFDDDISNDTETAGCWEHNEGDRIYAVAKGYTSKSAEPYPHPDVKDDVDGKAKIIRNEFLWYYDSAEIKQQEGNNKNLSDLAIHLNDMTRKKDATDYYTFDNFESVTRGRLNSETYIANQEDGAYNYFKNVSAPIFRQSRPEQCKVIVQAVDSAGRNKAWADKVETGSEQLPPPLSYARTDPACVPYGAIPPVQSPSNIVVEPVNKKDQQTRSAVQVPLELYHPENLENKDTGLLCKEAHRGEGFYACGGLCAICNPILEGVANPGKFCLTDADCGGVPASCQVAIVANTYPTAVAASKEKAIVENAPNEGESGLRRVQRIFAKVFGVWEWRPGTSQTAKDLQKETGIATGEYKKLSDEDLKFVGSSDFSWSKTQDIGNLAFSCGQKTDGSTIPIPNTALIYGTGKSSCEVFPGCRNQAQCIPDDTNPDTANTYRDYDYCKKNGEERECDDHMRCQQFGRCVPDHNQYPNVANIKVNTMSDGIVTLQEGGRSVSLDFDITLNPNQKPIKTVMVDWGDGTQTALSGLSFDAGHRTFTHTYAFYPESFSERPTTCKKYPTTDDPYECRYRPRIKVVDNWGWCNGAKLVTDSSGAPLTAGTAYVATEVVSEALKNGALEEDGYSWGYYSADCFKSYNVKLNDQGNPVAENDDNAVYAMQSWDYFSGIIKVPELAKSTSDMKPTIAVSFFQGQTDITADLLADGHLGSGDDKKAITTNDILSVWITCADNQGLKSCNFAEGDTGANLNCLGDLQNKLSDYCPSSTSCYAQNFECKFTSTGEWIYNITAIDNNDQSQTEGNPVPFVVQ